MNFHTNIALHYLKPKNNSFISLLSFISISGIAIGVMALIVVISVMSGFDHALENKVIGIESQIIVLNYKGSINHYNGVMKDISAIKGVKSVSPFIYTDVMISAGGTSTGSVLRGIDIKTEEKVTNLKKYLIKGSLNGLDSKKYNGIVFGKVLAQNLGVSVGDNVLIMSPQGQITPFGVVPKTERFTVCGIINSGMYNYDSTFSFISIKNAQMFLGLPPYTITGIEVKLDKLGLANLYAKKIDKILNKKPSSSFYALSWEELNKNLFSAIRLEKLTMFIILSLIVLVAAFNIISTLIMVVMEKRKDIAILKSIGASSRDIMIIFIAQGVIIGLVGTSLGLISGFLIGYLEKTYHIISLPSSVYYITTLPIRMTPSEFIVIGSSALFLSFIATLYPSYKASKIDPAEGVRHE
ncbi:MAG: lipoprotein-releasing ABC transporter permease subunit [Deltaproteobacteria bacterium]|nr:lipoprotein-releasing ABC transporter permease subunit [Deltaproteobacteria bacterium]MCL5879412.1 lipoprotein-releasing ABC transporter permease subunit [Deltaproteobacteria bacterium]MDA8304427.1 lipoprotein-releasing ABC transporter permease subunit [Deltaproteobacteria bacterium]